MAYVSPSTFARLHLSSKPSASAKTNYTTCFKATFKRLPPPVDSSSPSPTPPVPVARIIKPGITDQSKAPSDSKEDIGINDIFIGSLNGLAESHIVFPAAPDGVEDWDVIK